MKLFWLRKSKDNAPYWVLALEDGRVVGAVYPSTERPTWIANYSRLGMHFHVSAQYGTQAEFAEIEQATASFNALGVEYIPMFSKDQ